MRVSWFIRLGSLDQGRDAAVKALRRAGGEVDFTEGAVFFEDIDGAELIEVEAGDGR